MGAEKSQQKRTTPEMEKDDEMAQEARQRTIMCHLEYEQLEKLQELIKKEG